MAYTCLVDIPDHLSFVSEQNAALTPHLNYYNSILS